MNWRESLDARERVSERARATVNSGSPGEIERADLECACARGADQW